MVGRISSAKRVEAATGVGRQSPPLPNRGADLMPRVSRLKAALLLQLYFELLATKALLAFWAVLRAKKKIVAIKTRQKKRKFYYNV